MGVYCLCQQNFRVGRDCWGPCATAVPRGAGRSGSLLPTGGSGAEAAGQRLVSAAFGAGVTTTA